MAKKFPTYAEWRRQNGNTGTQQQYLRAKAEYDRFQTQRRDNRKNFFNGMRYGDMPIQTQMKQELIDRLDDALSNGSITSTQYNQALKREFANSMIDAAGTTTSVLAPEVIAARMNAAARGVRGAQTATDNTAKAVQTISNKPNLSEAQKQAQIKWVTAGNNVQAQNARAYAANQTNSAYNMAAVGFPTAVTTLGVAKANVNQGSATLPQGYGPVNPNYPLNLSPGQQSPSDLNGGRLPEVVIKANKPTETVSQKWTRITGLPWSEAKKRGFTTGSYDDNVRISKMLDQGYFDKGGSNEVYWNNNQDNAARMHEVMIPAYEAGMTPYEYSVMLADQRNRVDQPSDFNGTVEYAIGDPSMRGNYDDEPMANPQEQTQAPSYSLDDRWIIPGNSYNGLPTQILYSPQVTGDTQYAHEVYGYPGTAYNGNDYPAQYDANFDVWSGYGNQRYVLSD